MYYKEEQECFLKLEESKRSSLFNKTEIRVLSSFYAKNNPCAPDDQPFLNRMAQVLYNLTKINTIGAAYHAAKSALDSGREKVREIVFSNTPEEPPLQLVGSQSQASPPWWLRDDFRD